MVIKKVFSVGSISIDVEDIIDGELQFQKVALRTAVLSFR
jgi:hypothetical protein